MANQIVLAWSVDATGTTFTPAQAAAALGAVVLYADAVTDPVLGQGLGLTVATDTTAPTVSGATRTLTLNMTPSLAPPPFPCHPTTPTPPVLPYSLERTVLLAGSGNVATGTFNVPTTANQIPALKFGDLVQFASQPGVDYPVAAVIATEFSLSTPYLGPYATATSILKVLPAASKLPAVYSTSSLDAVAGSGARQVTVSYTDSLGAPGFATVDLAGKRPVQLVLAVGTIDVAAIVGMFVVTTGGFHNSVGQITLCDLSAPILNVVGGIQDTDDQAQMKISRGLAYLPPSYFSLAQQGAATPQLTGDFQVSPNSINVVTTVDQTAVLAAGNTMQFAIDELTDPDEIYTIASITPKLITLTAPYSGLVPATTGAFRVTPSPAAAPSDDQLRMLLAQYINAGNVLPSGAMTPAPTYLSDFFTQTISVALAVPVTSAPIALV